MFADEGASHGYAERSLAEMLDALPDRVSRYRFDDLRIIYCNRAWAAGHHATPAEMVGRRLDELLSPPELVGMHEQLARLSVDDPLVPDQTPRAAPEDPSRWILWLDQLLPGPNGGEVLSIGRDVTDRHRTEAQLWASERRFHLAMRKAPVGMLIVDNGDGSIVEVNPAFCALIGRDEDELVGASWEDISHPDDVEAGRAHAARLLAGEVASYSVEKRYLRADGSARWVELNVSLMHDADGKPRHRIGQVMDITARLEQERALQRIIEAEREAADRLRQFDEVKNAFLSAVSHELRTPLTVVRGMAATLQRLRDVLAGPTRRELEDALVHHADHLSELLEDLLDVDRLARGLSSSRPVSFDVVETLREAVAASEVADRVTLDAPEQLGTRADRVQVRRILSNLLDNVAKYAPDGPVLVRLTSLPGGGCRLEVSDRGPGIPGGELAEVFAPFHRVGREHPQPGTGIGLALVAGFAKLHGGRAWAQDDPDGAHLVVELPSLVEADEPDVRPPTAAVALEAEQLG